MKRLAAAESLRSEFNHEITSAKGFYDFMKKKKLKTIPFLISTEEINQTAKDLDQRYDNAVLVKGTQKFHDYQVDETDSNFLLVKTFSESKNTVKVRINKK